MIYTLRRFMLALLVATLGLSSSLQAVVGQGVPQGEAEYAKGEVLVSYKDGVDVNDRGIFTILNTILGQNQFTQVIFEKLSTAFVKSDQFTTQELLAKFRALDSVKSVSPNYVNHIMGATNDTHYNELWAMENRGENGGLNDADIDAKEAWDVENGSRDVVVAVVDTGVDYTHDDLVANMWDGSAYGIPNHGYDFSGSNDDDPMPGHSHGTHVAGTIGASANNNLGVVGVSQEVSIMALKVFPDDGGGASDSDILEAMEFIADMIDQGVNIVAINASYGGGGRNDTMKDAIEELGRKGVIMCAAAGNDDEDNDAHPHYPSSYDLDNIISVAATDNRDELASFSNYGQESVDLAAPGVDILSTIKGDGYDSWNGTSMATPHVTGAVALLAAKDANTTVAQRVELLLSTVDHISELSNKVASGGRLNVYTALTGEPSEGGEDPADENVTSWTTGAYDNNEDRREELRITDATDLVVTISGETEARYDYIYIYDAAGNQIAKLDGVLDETITVEGSSITARLTSDGSVTKSGVTVNIAIPEEGGEDPVDGNVTSWTTGAYDNNEDRSEVLSISDATALTVSIEGETESRYDFIYIYDENGKQIAKLDGKLNKTLAVDGSSIRARLTSDGSVTKSGVTVSIKVKEEPAQGDETSWTTGAYENNEDRSQVLSIEGSTSLLVTVEGETERRYDFIYLYDENGNQVAKLDGDIDTSASISGSSIRARLTSDGSITKSGVTVTITAE